MIVFDLSCDGGHAFEGWFDSSDAFERQRERGMLECPLCGIRTIAKLPSAPRLNLGGGSATTMAPVDNKPDGPVSDKDSASRAAMVVAQTAFYRHLREMLQNSDNVGERFPEEARRIHYKEAPERQIHGIATREETAELLEEGIAVLPVPVVIKRNDELN